MEILEAVKKFHWMNVGEDGVVEMFLDHHSLSTFRMCEAAFELSLMANIKTKTRNWNLEFGILYHKMIEEFYIAKRDNCFAIDKWLGSAIKMWTELRMDEFDEHLVYKKLNGLDGFATLLIQYAEHFASEVDRLRVIGIEITFGKKKEVPLGEFKIVDDDYILGINTPVRCYLTGRIDFLMDSGTSIGPLDHKTTAFFGKDNIVNSYDPQEGMTGYIFSTREILKRNFPDLLGARKVDRIWMNFASITPPPDGDPLKRFKRIPIFKQDWQLEQYRLRQLRTFHKIYDLVIGDERPDWNTSMCNNMFHKPCQYQNLHKQGTNQDMIQILNTDFRVAAPWNPEDIRDE